MSDDVFAVTLRCGRLQLAFGTEVGLTALELAVSGDQTRLDLDNLPGTARQLHDLNGGSGCRETIFIAAPYGDDKVETLEVRTYGPDDVDITNAVRNLDANVGKGIVAEAAFAAWRQRLADAADSLGPLTNADAGIVGPIDVPGSPLLTELRADRRRTFSAAAKLCGADGDVETVVDGVVTDLRAAVRFGAAGLAGAADGLLAESIALACRPGGWVDRLKLLITAEEVSAIELHAFAASQLATSTAEGWHAEDSDRLLAKYESERRQAEELAALLRDVIDRLPIAPRNPAKRLVRRKAMRDVQMLRETVEAYSTVVSAADTPSRDATSWEDAVQAVIALDSATSDEGDGPQFADQPTHSIDDAATALGQLFAAQLPVARAGLHDLAHQHPGVDVDGLTRIVKRQAVIKVASASRHTESGQPIQEVVAEFAMCIALLRGIEPHTDLEFEDLGRRILERADKIANLHAQAGTAVPVAVTGLSRFAQQFVAEYVFHKLGGLKPQKPGVARDAYKTVRSKVWRARHDEGVAAAAADGASSALLKVIDAGAPRLIVRHVDRSLPAPKR
jgi:hypothetical protein